MPSEIYMSTLTPTTNSGSCNLNDTLQFSSPADEHSIARSISCPVQPSTAIARGPPNPSSGLPPPQPEGNQQHTSQSNHGYQATNSADFLVETSVENSQQRSQQLGISKCMLLSYGCFH